MSRLDDNYLENPSVYFAEWDSDNKCFKYYKKYAEPKTVDGKTVKGENVLLKLPYTFLVLDMMYTIRGYNDDMGQGYYSNEVKDLKTGIFTVRVGKAAIATGNYKEIMAQLRDAKFCQSVYVAVKHEKNLVIANIQLKGAAVSAWIDFCSLNRKSIYKKAIAVKEFTDAKKGKTEYTVPTFELIDVSPETDEQAKALCAELAEYHRQYFSLRDVAEITANEQQNKPASEGINRNIRAKGSMDFPPLPGADDEPPLTQAEHDENITVDDLPF